MNKNLKWLAENVHEWENGCCLVQKTGEHFDFLSGDDLNIYGGVGDVCFTRAQWQAARDELGLNNKKKFYTVDEVIDELDIRQEVNEASVALGFRKWRGSEDGLPP